MKEHLFTDMLPTSPSSIGQQKKRSDWTFHENFCMEYFVCPFMNLFTSFSRTFSRKCIIYNASSVTTSEQEFSLKKGAVQKKELRRKKKKKKKKRINNAWTILRTKESSTKVREIGEETAASRQVKFDEW